MAVSSVAAVLLCTIICGAVANDAVISPKVPANSVNVLVTGFGPFLNYTHNPSQAVAENLDKTCSSFPDYPIQVCYEGWVLDVNHDGSSKVANEISGREQLKWGAIIHCGLEDSAKGLKLETVAANILAKDNSSSPDEPVEPGDPFICPTTANLNRINLPHLFSYTNINANDTKESWSRDAGSYYCNETYFRTCNTVRKEQIRGAYSNEMIPVMFVHLPSTDTMSIEMDTMLVSRIATVLVNSVLTS